MRILATLLCCAGLGIAPGVATAAGPARNADWPCAPGSPERADATRKLEALDAGIGSLKPEDSPAVLNDALVAMARHPCMALSRVGAEQLRAEASPALIDFWTNGGRHWIDDHLRVEEVEVLTFPPLMRKVMTPVTRPGHPALALLCPAGDAHCGQETAGWWQRAESYFKLTATPHALPSTDTDPLQRLIGRPMPTREGCWQQATSREALSAPSAQRYADWEDCVRATRRIGFAMPLGRLKAPTTGWLVIRGRRGHYSFCDEVRMYSLASGAAYVSQSCSELQIGSDMRPARRWQVVRGSMSIDNLREVLWMLLQLDEAAVGYPSWDSFVIPRELEPDRKREAPPASGDAEYIVSSDQTTLAWVWTDQAGAALASGTLRWPSDHARGPVDHAIALLQAAEGGIREGCPEEKPPANVSPGAAKPVVSRLDASPRELSATERELVAELNKVAGTQCRIPR